MKKISQFLRARKLEYDFKLEVDKIKKSKWYYQFITETYSEQEIEDYIEVFWEMIDLNSNLAPNSKYYYTVVKTTVGSLALTKKYYNKYSFNINNFLISDEISEQDFLHLSDLTTEMQAIYKQGLQSYNLSINCANQKLYLNLIDYLITRSKRVKAISLSKLTTDYVLEQRLNNTYYQKNELLESYLTNYILIIYDVSLNNFKNQEFIQSFFKSLLLERKKRKLLTFIFFNSNIEAIFGYFLAMEENNKNTSLFSSEEFKYLFSYQDYLNFS